MMIHADTIKEWVEPSLKHYTKCPKITLHYIMSFFRGKPEMNADQIAQLNELPEKYRVLILFRPEVLTDTCYQLAAKRFKKGGLSHQSQLAYIMSVLTTMPFTQ